MGDDRRSDLPRPPVPLPTLPRLPKLPRPGDPAPTAPKPAEPAFAAGTELSIASSKPPPRIPAIDTPKGQRAPAPPELAIAKIETVKIPVAKRAESIADGIPRPIAARSSQVATAVDTDPAEELRELESRLSRCLASLHMHFQPIVDATTRERFGYEALLRCKDKALPHPGAILDAAERLERVTALGRAIRLQTANVIADAPAARGVVFINLHVLDLLDRQLTSPFSPLSKVSSRVVLEITERSSLEEHVDVRYRIAELRELGFRIAVDDLGGGHARMGALTPLDTDFVKLDMALVRDVDRHPMKQRLIRSIIELCRAHGTKVVGEGVETDAEARVLVELGCDYLQGYFIAKPAPPFADPL